MNVRRIRESLSVSPFRPVELVLTSGQRFLVRHPEHIWIRDQFLVVDVEGNPAIFEPDAVVSIRRLVRNGGRTRA